MNVLTIYIPVEFLAVERDVKQQINLNLIQWESGDLRLLLHAVYSYTNSFAAIHQCMCCSSS